jgi:uncharacterized membrane protein
MSALHPTNMHGWIHVENNSLLGCVLGAVLGWSLGLLLGWTLGTLLGWSLGFALCLVLSMALSSKLLVARNHAWLGACSFILKLAQKTTHG